MAKKIDYEKLGFRCGIEIHQQLETHKLFCNCPGIVHDSHPNITFKRRLRPVVGETGEIDKAAAFEFSKKKEIRYEACSTSCCLVEMDESPPNPINEEALKIALQIAKLLNTRIEDEIQVMRKIVVDGSNVTGFQRTALIAQHGWVETSKGKVNIPVICLEEEAAQRIEETDSYIKFRLDRLGIPLVEIATDSSIKDSEHAKEVAEKLGMVLRSTGKVKRGIGTIRQDVNISIEGGARTEIKGFQELKAIPKIIEFEIKRQLELIKKKEKIEKTVRKAEPDFTTSFLRPLPGAARMYPETDVIPIKISSELIEFDGVELIEDRINKLVKSYKLDKDIAKSLVKSKQDSLFVECADKFKKLKPAFIADTLLSAVKQVKNEFVIDISPSNDDFKELFDNLEKGAIAKESVLDILSENKPVRDVLHKFKLMSDETLESELKRIVKEHRDLAFNTLIGRAMEKLRGKAEGRKIVEMLKKLTS